MQQHNPAKYNSAMIEAVYESLEALPSKELAETIGEIKRRLDQCMHQRRMETEPVYSVINSVSRRYPNHSKVLSDLVREVNNEQIIMYIEQTNDYILFKDVANYMEFIGNSARTSKRDLTFKDYEKYQIILENTEHALTLMYSSDLDEITAAKIKAAVLEKFKVDTRIMTNNRWGTPQISTDLTVRGFADSESKCRELRAHLDDYSISRNISVPPVDTDKLTGQNYITPTVMHSDDAVVTDFREMMRDLPYPRPVNITVNIGNINIGAININVKGESAKHRVSREWIKANPPNDHESTSEYYEKYKMAMAALQRQAYPTNQIYKYIRAEGFSIVQTTGGRKIWIKK